MISKRDASAFVWVGNHPGLDLVNTEAADTRGERLELVPDWPALVDWARSATLIDEELAEQCHQAGGRRGDEVLAWFQTLRASVRAVIEPSGHARAAAQALDAAVADVGIRLSYQPTQAPGTLPVTATHPLEQLRLSLATAALGAAQLDRTRIRRCASATCVLLYYDTSKNRSRRWCDMAACGNRAKASTHYRRASKHPSTRRRSPDHRS
jgi:predicted RNA-binding Zn ribbon-like protein